MKLQMYRPTISNRLTQKFGDNRACIYPNGKIVGKRGMVCPAGSQDFYKSIGMKAHNGQDWAAWHGEPVFHCATFPGKMKIEKDFSGGIGVDVISLEPIEFIQYRDGKKYAYKDHVKIRYWHLKAPVGYDGKIVHLGEQIGLADNTGSSSGDHVHLGAKRCTPDGESLDPNNGYTGAFDFTDHMIGTTDAKTASEYLRTPPPPLSTQELKEINSLLSSSRKLLNLLLELKRRM